MVLLRSKVRAAETKPRTAFSPAHAGMLGRMREMSKQLQARVGWSSLPAPLRAWCSRRSTPGAARTPAPSLGALFALGALPGVDFGGCGL